jgi:hypothetical protein
LRDFFAVSGDNNDLLRTEFSLSRLSIDFRVKFESESDFVAMVWIVTLKDDVFENDEKVILLSYALTV